MLAGLIAGFTSGGASHGENVTFNLLDVADELAPITEVTATTGTVIPGAFSRRLLAGRVVLPIGQLIVFGTLPRAQVRNSI